MANKTQHLDPLQTIPVPADVREILGERLREVAILRRLLKVSEQAERERSEREGVSSDN